MQLTNQQFASLYKPSLNPTPTHDEICTMRAIFVRNREWFDRETNLRALHPAVNVLLQDQPPIFQYITDWREMLLEWPHESKEDPTKLAYTQSDDKGERDIQTRTTIGKYLRKHMPNVPDHELRDYVAQFTIEGNCYISDSLDDIVRVVMNGPDSCMKKSRWSADDHPYRVYLPEYGWAIAWREEAGRIVGRALLNHREDEDNIFVRSYKQSGSGYSQSDEHLEAWLTKQGYTHESGWDGCKVARIENDYNNSFVMPYLDGNDQSVDDCGTHMEIVYEGEYDANNTDGWTSGSGVSCPDCGDTVDEYDLISVGYYGDHAVCECCVDNEYTYVHGRGRDQYYVANDYAVWCKSNDEWYHCDYLEDYDVVWCEDDGEYYLGEDVWYCEGSGNYYHVDTTSYEIEGEFYHADHLPDGYYIDEEGVLCEHEEAVA